MARIFTGTSPAPPRASTSVTASEYASSPVEHPGTQTRRAASGPRSRKSAGTAACWSRSNTSGSRKNRVTPMSRSRVRAASSAGSSRAARTNSSTDANARNAIRRATRRRMAFCLYGSKSIPVLARRSASSGASEAPAAGGSGGSGESWFRSGRSARRVRLAAIPSGERTMSPPAAALAGMPVWPAVSSS